MRFSITTIVSLVTASATLVSSASIMRPDGDNGSCAQLHRICAGQVQYDLNNVWAIESCLFAGICYERQSANLDHFLAPPNSLTSQRVPPPVFVTISKGGQTSTQQNYIDAYYGTLDVTHGPYPTSPEPAIFDYHRMASWTGFCDGVIPYQNFADYFQFSATRPANFCPNLNHFGFSASRPAQAPAKFCT
ncbi:uncharacterized protein STEHIDRAFT_108151 [Stereum hirsutum FP-91666 SS1]|uniref:uncharacterized protein n=1 Tax=Stereum hirsutum (strain FP-91666) TaxID=721885 RepID=UPI000440CAD2|nr:uncharacterized protein STEHIDRAFT_108151 [Stereum hirsutum FP-91666 SS1]EIM91645.1 hypothetical protein STEHIDRAFT_108151 [Stereum hirsutum FP-91666 SS1]